MSVFNLEWFKSKSNAIKALEEQIKKEKKELEEITGTVSSEEKPYLNVKLVNDLLTVVLNDGNIISKTNATVEDFKAAREATSEEELLIICSCADALADKKAKEAEIAKAKAILDGLENLKNYPQEFIVEDNTLRFKGIDRTLPQLMMEEILTIVATYNNPFQTDQYKSIKRFFMWCCLNPRPEVANELYRFLKENSFRITKQGFFVALRNVVTLHGSNELVQFVSNTYNKVKAVWRKDPSDYRVFLNSGNYELVHHDDIYEMKIVTCENCDGDGEYWNDEPSEYGDEPGYETCGECEGEGQYERAVYKNRGEDLGCLTDLYLDLPNRHENRFTDDWTKTFDIRIGQPVSMPQVDCNWSTQDCAAAGLHFTADQIHYVGCGDQSVLVLINPMKVVGIGQYKGRCYEYLPIMTVPREEATQILHDGAFDTLQLDEQFAIDQLSNLELLSQEGFVIEASKHKFYMPQISISEIKGIVRSLEEMKSELSGRVKNI